MLCKSITYDPVNAYRIMNISLFNDWKHDSVMNFTMEYLVSITAMKISAKVVMPRDEQDKDYKRTFFQTTVDVNKVFDGLRLGSFILKAAMESFFTALKTPPEFPILAVRDFLFCHLERYSSGNIQQGVIGRVENFTVSSKYVPPLAPSSKGAVIMRIFSKILGRKVYIQTSNLKFFGEYRKDRN